MLQLFRSRPLIEAASADWIFAAYEWALQHFDSEDFFQRSRLVQPTNSFFPGRVDSVHAKADNIFQHTLAHAGLSHWPFQLQAPEAFHNAPAPQLPLNGITRHSDTASLPALIPADATAPVLYITYNPQQTLKPEDLASSYAHLIAQHLVGQSRQLPPGGADYLAEGTELLAVFMGFGVMLANSAYTFRGSCGSCYNSQANRQATLSEDEVIFALALYCRLKGIATTEACRHLKSHLKKSFKRALKQINQQPERLAPLLNYRTTTLTPG